MAFDGKHVAAEIIPPGAAYLGQKPPGEKPERFAPGILSANPFLGRLAFSPDGSECFFTVDDATYSTQSLFLTRYVNGVWTPQVLAPFAAEFEKSGEPFFSPDGSRLYFTAQAKGSGSRMDIWMVDRSAQGWGTPTRLPAPINSDANDFCFSKVLDGTMYFLSNRSGAAQVYRARQNADQTFQVELVPAPVLSVGTYEGDPCVAPDGRFLVFYSGRAGGFGAVDLQASFPDGKGEWTRPVNLGADFNTPADEYGATLSPDGKYLFFVRHSEQKGELYWVSTRAIEKLAPAPTRPQEVTANEFGLKVLRVSPRVAVVHGDPWNNAVLAIATRKGIVVVDSSWSESVAKGFREAIQAEFKRSDFACLINSHEHADHIGGNAAYADVPIIGHESVRREMLKKAADLKTRAEWRELSADKEIKKMHDFYLENAPAILETTYYAGCVRCWQAIEKDFHGDHSLLPPSVTFDRQLTLHFDDITVKLAYFGGFHSVGDTIISVPEENLVMIGQLFLPDSDTVPIATKPLAESTTPQMVDEWFAVLQEVLKGADENTRFMACSQRRFMKKEHCQRFLAYLSRLWAGVRSAKADGKTLEQAKAALPLQGFPEVAKLPNEAWRGTEWEIRDIHQQNTEYFWRVLG